MELGHVVEGSTQRRGHGALKGCTTSCGVRVPACKLGKRWRGRRANDLIEIWGCFGPLYEYSKALMPETKFAVRALDETWTNRIGVMATLFSLSDTLQ